MKVGAGRPTKGVGHVDAVEGSRGAKRRLKVILEVTSGGLAVRAGAKKLGLSITRLEQLRSRALEGAVASLEPRAPGRQRKTEEEAPEVGGLRRELDWAAWDLEAARVREEIALMWPHLKAKGAGRPAPGKAGASRSGRPRPGARRGTSGRPKG